MSPLALGMMPAMSWRRRAAGVNRVATLWIR
ncbi:hypothetical protein [Microbacterium sp. PAMC22086]